MGQGRGNGHGRRRVKEGGDTPLGQRKRGEKRKYHTKKMPGSKMGTTISWIDGNRRDNIH